MIRHLYEIRHEKEFVQKLFRFIDWLIRLPKDLEKEFWYEIRQYEEERRMPYVTSVEIIGIKKGLKEGIELGLDLKFGSEGLLLMPDINEIEDLDILEAIKFGIKTAKTIDELRKIYD
ncbi:MAG: hypothetical protein AAB116_07430 [Candidatus Poribacteria bacterium]